MRLRNNSGKSALRFVFDRTIPAAPERQSAPPTAAALENPYGRYYSTARSREELARNREERNKSE